VGIPKRKKMKELFDRKLIALLLAIALVLCSVCTASATKLDIGGQEFIDVNEDESVVEIGYSYSGFVYAINNYNNITIVCDDMYPYYFKDIDTTTTVAISNKVITITSEPNTEFSGYGSEETLTILIKDNSIVTLDNAKFEDIKFVVEEGSMLIVSGSSISTDRQFAVSTTKASVEDQSCTILINNSQITALNGTACAFLNNGEYTISNSSIIARQDIYAKSGDIMLCGGHYAATAPAIHLDFSEEIKPSVTLSAVEFVMGKSGRTTYDVFKAVNGSKDVYKEHIHVDSGQFNTKGTLANYLNENRYIISGAGLYIVTEPLAKLNDTNFPCFEDALKAASDGDTITLLDDCPVFKDVDIDALNLNIDLNGYKLYDGDKTFYYNNDIPCYVTINSGSSITIDGSKAGSGTERLQFYLSGEDECSKSAMTVTGGTYNCLGLKFSAADIPN